MARLSVEKSHQLESVRMVSTIHQIINPTPSNGAMNLQKQHNWPEQTAESNQCSHDNNPDPGKGPVSLTKFYVECATEFDDVVPEHKKDEKTATEN